MKEEDDKGSFVMYGRERWERRSRSGIEKCMAGRVTQGKNKGRGEDKELVKEEEEEENRNRKRDAA